MMKSFSFFLALLAVTHTVFAYEEEDVSISNSIIKPLSPKIQCGQTNYCPAYSAPADVKVKCGWNVEVDMGFIYWYAGQDDMDVASATVTNSATTSTTSISFQEFEYKPGFQISLGCDIDRDNWVFNAEYTWIRNHVWTQYTPPTDGTWSTNNWFTSFGLISGIHQLSSKWTLNVDLIDATLSRPYFEGKKLTFSPILGLRAFWMRQRFSIKALDGTSNAQQIQDGKSINVSQSWALGPRLGFDGFWILGDAFRIEGNLAGSVLYNRYFRLSQKDSIEFTDHTLSKNQAKSKDQSQLTPILDAGMGFGWGTHLSCCRYYIDLSARYDYMYLWSQNKMRDWIGGAVHGFDDGTGDLWIHGLTVQARFDF